MATTMARNEAERVRRFQGGDAEAFDALYDSYGQRVYHICHRLTGNASDAQDLAQEVFVAAFRGLHRFDGRASLGTYLHRIALYRWQRLGRERGPESARLSDAPHVAASAPDLERATLDRMALERALGFLPDEFRFRAAFMLVKGEGMKYREAADTLGVPQGTVQSRVLDSSRCLRAVLEDEPDVRARCPKRCGKKEKP